MSFSRYNPEDSVISAETVVRGLWTGDNNLLNTFATASGYSEYYLDVYQTTPGLPEAEIQFDIQYGNLNGSGSAPINPDVIGYSPSRTIYGQYRNLVYGTETTNFSFDGGVTTATDIFVINISRARYKQSIQPGTLNLTLSYDGSITLNDDSTTTNLTRFIGENRVYYIIQGTDTSTYYGIMLPDLGIIILDASTTGPLSNSYIEPVSHATTAVYNEVKLYNSIVLGQSGDKFFQLQSQEVISSRYFFTRVKNSEFNYTTNPSIIDDNGNILYTTLINNPQTYVTTVGMYNDSNELLAVAKLSKPLVKDFTKEALIRVKLDY